MYVHVAVGQLYYCTPCCPVTGSDLCCCLMHAHWPLWFSISLLFLLGLTDWTKSQGTCPPPTSLSRSLPCPSSLLFPSTVIWPCAWRDYLSLSLPLPLPPPFSQQPTLILSCSLLYMYIYTTCLFSLHNTSTMAINHFVPITQGLLTIMTSSTVEVHGGTVLQAVRYRCLVDWLVNYRGMGSWWDEQCWNVILWWVSMDVY